MASEFLICGISASSLGKRLAPLGVSVFDPSGIHQRILAANDANADPSRLLVPIIPGSVWSRLSQIVSKQRAGSLRWAVAADDLDHFVPVWAHLMPAAKVVSLTDIDDAVTTVGELL